MGIASRLWAAAFCVAICSCGAPGDADETTASTNSAAPTSTSTAGGGVGGSGASGGSPTGGGGSPAGSGGSSNGGSAPDIYEHSFEDGTAGIIQTGTNAELFGNSPWALGTDGGARGSNYIYQVYQSPTHPSGYPTGNLGIGAHFTSLPGGGYDHLFVRFAYRQDTGFNQDNCDVVKVIRLQHTGTMGQHIGTLVVDGFSDVVSLYPDNLDAMPFSNDAPATPLPNINTFQGSWHWYEIELDLRTAGHYVYRVWVDDVLHYDVDRLESGVSGQVVDKIQVNGTINSLCEQSRASYDHFGLSTQRMGIPPT